MRAEEFQALKTAILEREDGYIYAQEIEWQEKLLPCTDAMEFASQAIWVIISSGMKNQVARIIEDRVFLALPLKAPLIKVFRHKGKTDAIQYIWDNRDRLFSEYQASVDKLDYLQTLPWVGGITKYHLAKNLGLDVVKPDRHIQRMSEYYNKTPDKLCADLAAETGLRKATVDLILWRAANLGIWKPKA